MGAHWKSGLIFKSAEEERIMQEAHRLTSGFDRDRKMQLLDTIAMTFLKQAHLPKQCETHPPKLQNRRR